MWREMATTFPDAVSRPPAAEEALAAIERHLGQPVPEDLRALLLETDGIEDDCGTETVWTAERILAENADFRAAPDFRELYQPFDSLMFFGDNGGGDQFAFVRTPRRDDVFVWDHETDSRTWVAPSLKSYLRSALGSEGDDWYRSAPA
ncbi:SMI1/KNR4 family protein [Streptomyces sp. VRA16 Mangrove soil]|uniref:SMI1/KNR4 family protein n=1 Tax=Streptomyces sp. VRA16 Mangrove soil TaxID=2817434 RepID=UPI001A9F0CEE|nr:SMI1/KNR4 family protein [Streptomyces sp. VRA16 Mangrove soil]MBO1333484.1 SMI1/KNR4 family protein [Streptomyces sp. VRA16 Mangrove soil]